MILSETDKIKCQFFYVYLLRKIRESKFIFTHTSFIESIFKSCIYKH